MVSDGGERFIPAYIVGVHTLSLLLSSQVSHDRATEDNHTQEIRQPGTELRTERNHLWVQYMNLDREVLNPSPCE